MKIILFSGWVVWATMAASAQESYLTSTIAGTPGTSGYSGDSGPASAAQLATPFALAVDTKGNYYIADYKNYVIRKVGADGTINTVAGNGTFGYSGDGGPAVQAQLSDVQGLAVDPAGNLYIADTINSRVRVVDSSGNINTYAGTGTRGAYGVDIPALNADLYFPTSLALDKSGNLFIADRGNGSVRKVSPQGMISTVAGGGISFFDMFPGEGGPAVRAALGQPTGVAVDSAGDVYIADVGSASIRKVGTDGLIHTVVSNVTSTSLAADQAGNVYYSNYRDSTITRLYPSGVTQTIAGEFYDGFSGDGNPGLYAVLNVPYGIALDPTGNIYVADSANNVVRLLKPVPASSIAVTNGASDAVGPVAPGEIVTLFGTGLAASAQAAPDSAGRFESQLAGTMVTFDGIPAPVLSTNDSQITVIVPYEVNGSQTKVAVTTQGSTVASGTVAVAASSPGIFKSMSSGLQSSGFQGSPVLNADGSVNSGSNPAADSSTITLFVTGEGQTSPAGIDGLITQANAPPVPLLGISVNINGENANVVSATEAPGQVAGVLQVSVTLPSDVTANSSVPVYVYAGNTPSQIVNIAVQ